MRGRACVCVCVCSTSDGAIPSGNSCRCYTAGGQSGIRPVATCERPGVVPKEWKIVGVNTGSSSVTSSCPTGWSVSGCSCHSYWHGCQNDGSASMNVGSASCSGSGTRITISAICYREDHCKPTSCLNGGTCINGDGGFSCTCTEGWEGAFCETEVTCPAITKPTTVGEVCLEGRRIGSTCTLTCAADGFQGSSTRTCQSDRSWSGANPTCTKVECGTLTVVPTGTSVSCDGTDYGSVCTFSCPYLKTPTKADPTVTCQANGQWSTNDVRCVDATACASANLGQSIERAGESCNAILQDAVACGAGTPPTGQFFVRAEGDATAKATYCDMETGDCDESC